MLKLFYFHIRRSLKTTKLFKIWNAKGKMCIMADSLIDVLTKGNFRYNFGLPNSINNN